MIQAEIYPFQPSKKTVEVYDNIATKLHTIVLEVANKLNLVPTDIRASLDGLWYDKDKHRGLAIQIKSKDNIWEKPWSGNNLIIQTLNSEGVIIKTNDFDNIELDGNRSKELRSIFDNACDLELDKHVMNLIKDLVNSLTSSDIKAVAPNTPIVVTGRAK